MHLVIAGELKRAVIMAAEGSLLAQKVPVRPKVAIITGITGQVRKCLGDYDVLSFFLYES